MSRRFGLSRRLRSGLVGEERGASERVTNPERKRVVTSPERERAGNAGHARSTSLTLHNPVARAPGSLAIPGDCAPGSLAVPGACASGWLTRSIAYVSGSLTR